MPPEPPAARAGDRERAVEVAAEPAAALAAIAEAAEGWGADWRADPDGAGGRLALPTLAGIRRGVVAGRVRVEPLAAGRSRVRFEPETEELRLHAPSVAVLLFAAAGGLVTVLWPFYPALLPAAPLGAVIALGGWFLVVSRLRTAGPDELLELVAGLCAREGGAGPEPGPQAGDPPRPR